MINQYYDFINKLASDCVHNNNLNGDRRNPLNLSDVQMAQLDNFISIREQLTTGEELRSIQYQIPLCINFKEIDEHKKMLLGLIYRDVSVKASQLLLYRDFKKYEMDQPIFKLDGLYDKVRECHELIDYSALRWVPSTEIFSYKGKYLQTGAFLKTQMLNFLWTIKKPHGIYIRLDPYFLCDRMPSVSLQEEAMRPVDSKWIKNLGIFKGKNTGGHYFIPSLDHFEPKTELELKKYQERGIKGVCSLELTAKRNHDDNLSMMLEEVTERKICDTYYISRCIHLDTNDGVGTHYEDSILNHIDLAINLYDSDSFAIRKEESLSNGKVVDATMRIHLVRLEDVPFALLQNLAWLFFESETLLDEWISDQFEIIT